MITLRFTSKAENVHKIKDFLQKIEETYHTTLSDTARHRLIIAISEAINNAIEHGGKFSEHSWIDVRGQRENNGLRVWVIDQGKGFDPSTLRDPRQDEALFQERGRGVFLMQNLSDAVQFYHSDAGFTVELWFDNIFSTP